MFLQQIGRYQMSTLSPFLANTHSLSLTLSLCFSHSLQTDNIIAFIIVLKNSTAAEKNVNMAKLYTKQQFQQQQQQKTGDAEEFVYFGATGRFQIVCMLVLVLICPMEAIRY